MSSIGISGIGRNASAVLASVLDGPFKYVTGEDEATPIVVSVGVELGGSRHDAKGATA
jgi:hypothetical protein